MFVCEKMKIGRMYVCDFISQYLVFPSLIIKGVEKVNVMEYLNIQKAEPVSSDKKGK